MMDNADRQIGRRPGAPDTRAEILAAARVTFAETGYERASIRSIASHAGVDPALVLHYFGSKDGLFNAAMALPLDPGELRERVFGAGLDGAGTRLAGIFLMIWESEPYASQMRGLLRAAVSHHEAARRLATFLEREIIPVAMRDAGGEQGRLHVELAASHLVGLAFARYILSVEPLASTPRDELVRIVGPVIQRYLAGAGGTPQSAEEDDR